MQEFLIGNEKRLCFVVKKGSAKTIVVTYSSLANIDLKRFFDMEKQGGELMRVMRDTTLDNGVNALVMYADMLIDVPNTVQPKEAKVKEVEVEDIIEDDAETEDDTEEEVKEHTERKSTERKSAGRNKAKK